MTPEERALDSYLSWSLGMALNRELLIRSGEITDLINDTERRWAIEGPRLNAEGELDHTKLDGVKTA